ncbi:hypothetical protein D3C81_530450 [compost metagenome]
MTLVVQGQRRQVRFAIGENLAAEIGIKIAAQIQFDPFARLQRTFMIQLPRSQRDTIPLP